jgi:hypothetical protein
VGITYLTGSQGDNQMPKFTVYALTTTQLVTEIEADTYEDACKYADDELITGDFDAINTDFTLGLVIEVK